MGKSVGILTKPEVLSIEAWRCATHNRPTCGGRDRDRAWGGRVNSRSTSQSTWGRSPKSQNADPIPLLWCGNVEGRDSAIVQSLMCAYRVSFQVQSLVCLDR